MGAAVVDGVDGVSDPEHGQVEPGLADPSPAAFGASAQFDQRNRRVHQITAPPFGLITWPTR